MFEKQPVATAWVRQCKHLDAPPIGPAFAAVLPDANQVVFPTFEVCMEQLVCLRCGAPWVLIDAASCLPVKAA